MSSHLRLYRKLGGEYYVHCRTVQRRCIVDSQHLSCVIISNILQTAIHLRYSFIVLEIGNCI